LDLKEPECDASGRSNLIHIADESSPNTGPTFPDGMTCEPSPAKDSSAPTLSAAGSHAKTLATLDSGQELKESKADSGESLRGSFAFFDLDSSSWKTLQRCLDGGWIPFSETFPRSGTLRNGTACQRQPLVRLTGGIASGLLPTLIARDSRTVKGAARSPNSLGAEPLVTVIAEQDGKTSGRLNPTWCEWFMGFPLGWTELPALDEVSSPKSPNGSDAD
jgi:hypothetical protein